MAADPIADLARRINAADAPKAVVYVAGGGTEVFPMLLARGGGSSTLLSGRIPYDPAEFLGLLGSNLGRLVDARAARGLAMAAFRDALKLRGRLEPEEVFGIGATSKLSRGEGEREGRAHEIHAALQSASRTVVRSVTLPPDLSRLAQERINAIALLNLLALGKGLDSSIPMQFDERILDDGQLVEQSAGIADLGSDVGEVLVGRRRWAAFDLTHGRIEPMATENPQLLLSGSFRPLHEGHRAMAEAASQITGLTCGFEISLFHPDKPPLDYLAIRSRLGGFGSRRDRVYLTDAPTFLEKARICPGCIFAMGHDTAVRILDSRYYGGIEGRDAMIHELEFLGTRFLVFGRVDASGQFRDFRPSEFEHPVAGFLERAARVVPEDVFRLDISSTEVRLRTGDQDT